MYIYIYIYIFIKEAPDGARQEGPRRLDEDSSGAPSVLALARRPSGGFEQGSTVLLPIILYYIGLRCHIEEVLGKAPRGGRLPAWQRSGDVYVYTYIYI